jgi:hypothetical protein
MNILFLTLIDFSAIDENGIYTDLMREFVKAGHDLYIISPTKKRKNEPTRLIENGKAKILKLQIGNTQKTNLIEKGIYIQPHLLLYKRQLSLLNKEIKLKRIYFLKTYFPRMLWIWGCSRPQVLRA